MYLKKTALMVLRCNCLPLSRKPYCSKRMYHKTTNKKVGIATTLPVLAGGKGGRDVQYMLRVVSVGLF